MKDFFNYQNLHLIIGAVIIIVLAYLKFKKLKFIVDLSDNLLKWIRPSFEDTNGQASSRRLTAFAIVVTYISCRLSYANHVDDSYYLLAALVVDTLFILLLFGIVTFQQIANFRNFKNNLPEPKKPSPRSKQKE